MLVPRRARLLSATGALVAGALLLSACGGSGGGSSDAKPPANDDPAFATSSRGPSPTTAAPSTGAQDGAPRVVGAVASGLDVPWGIGFLPDGSALVTERDSGKILQVTPGASGATGSTRQVASVKPNSQKGAESGLLGLAVSPTYAQDKQVFVYLTTEKDNRVLRGTFDGTRVSGLTPILTGIPDANIHDGGRLAFGPDGYLYVSTGETGQDELAQQSDSLGGKILRITKDGKPAPGNPEPNSPVWTLGHRNVQGLAFDEDDNLWASEFGAQTFDELNLIQKGTNYGWPEVEGKSSSDKYRNPRWSGTPTTPPPPASPTPTGTSGSARSRESGCGAST